MCPVFSLLSRLSGCIAAYYDESTSCVPAERDRVCLWNQKGGDDIVLIFENLITLGFLM